MHKRPVTPRTTRVTRADEHLEIALQHLGQALSLLGGKPRTRPRDPVDSKWHARDILHSIIVRMGLLRIIVQAIK